MDLSQSKNDWGLNEIYERDIRISDELLELLKNWGLNQVDVSKNKEDLIPILADRVADYNIFLKMFDKKDSNEERQRFLNM
nr:hypothetical protein [Liquorilactobacillus satsumensis]